MSYISAGSLQNGDSSTLSHIQANGYSPKLTVTVTGSAYATMTNLKVDAEL